MTTAVAPLARGTVGVQDNGQAAANSDSQRLLLSDITWEDYVKLGEVLCDRPALRLTYDRGTLELMTLSLEHEGYKSPLRRFVEVLAEEFGLPCKNLGSATNRREDLGRGLEPDECFYFANWKRIAGKKRLDLAVDPPPDFVLEVDVTHSSLDRLAIYAALGVPEVWRFDGKELRVYCLEGDGSYEDRPSSPTFPGISLKGVAEFVSRSAAEDDAALVRAFREWVRQQPAAQS